MSDITHKQERQMFKLYLSLRQTAGEGNAERYSQSFDALEAAVEVAGHYVQHSYRFAVVYDDMHIPVFACGVGHRWVDTKLPMTTVPR
jgi:hypothetical protein